MKIGIIHSSNKENEKRYPLHIEQILKFSDEELSKLIFEENYPGINQIDQLRPIIKMKREEVFSSCDLVVLPKPTEQDFCFFKNGQTVFGWLHCVQGREITQVGIDKALTYIAWESMYKWDNKSKLFHIFQRNNELAGYCAVMHALSLVGDTAGSYGKEKKIAVLGYGSSGKGTIHALKGLGCSDLTVYTRRKKSDISDAITNVKYLQYDIVSDMVLLDGKQANQVLPNYDIIVNCILQDTDNPITFLSNQDVLGLRKNLLIIDVSCDKGIGFEFAIPTSFENPLRKFNLITYYSVDHTPSYLWEAASYEISEAVFPFIKYMIVNGSYEGNEVLEKAKEIENGRIVNPKIIRYQKRNCHFPYENEVR